MNLGQLHHLLALAETGSFSRAAERLHLTQPALSRSILALEEELGLKLVDRVGKRNELTPFGRGVVERARRIVLETSELSRSAKLHQDGSSGPVHLGLGATPGAVLTVPLLTHLVRHHPRLKVVVSSGPVEMQLQALRARTLDALIVDARAVPPADDLRIEGLPPIRAGLCCRRGHPLLAERSLGFAALSRYPIAATPLNDESARQLIQSFGAGAHPDRFVTVQCENIGNLLETVRQTDAIFLGVLAAARALLDQGQLVELQPHPPLRADGSYALVTLAGRTEAPVLQAVRATIDQWMRD